MKPVYRILLGFIFVIALFSCRTVPVQQIQISRSLTGRAVLSEKQLITFFMMNNSLADRGQVTRLARYYISEAYDEGINSDVAFAQMCLETGFLRFGGLVTPEMHNYCGLGSIDTDHPGESFKTEQEGVRAHIQHLNAYGDTDSLVNPLVDKRAKWVTPRGKAPTVFELSGTWASDPAYGKKLDAILSKMESVR
ncbi:MAG: glucosaminidase domain-containing protein [Treponema sp.]|nr:glucosaminidase domain-containing protein [Treponema sp.]